MKKKVLSRELIASLSTYKPQMSTAVLCLVRLARYEHDALDLMKTDNTLIRNIFELVT